MGWAKRAIQGISTRDSLAYPSQDLFTALGGMPTYSGKRVTEHNALALIPVWRAINIRAGAIGSMPLEVSRKVTNDAGQPTTVPVPIGSRPWQLLHEQANENMSSAELLKIGEGHLCGWGNTFMWKEKGSDGRIANLWPLDPARVQVGRDANGKPIFAVNTYGPTPPGADYIVAGEQVFVDDSVILHIRGLSTDGMVGYAPIRLAREALGAMMAQQEFEGRFWANDATPGTVLIHPNKINNDAIKNIRDNWEVRHRGSMNARKTAVLGEAIKIETLGLPLDDAQFVQIAQMKRTDIALLFGLPPYMLAGDSGNTMTYSNSETQSLDLVKWSLRDEMTTIEQAFTRDPDIMPVSWGASFKADTILRGSMTERYTAYGLAPHLTVDDARAMEGLPPLPDGKGEILCREVGPAVIAAALKAGAAPPESVEMDGTESEIS